MTDRIAITALTAIGGHCGHHAGDYLVQADHDAQCKQQRNRTGRLSLLRHVATYTATQAATKATFYATAGVRVPAAAQLAGALTEGLLHGLIDDGRLLRRFADLTGKRGFHDVAGNGVNGRMLMDQASHQGLQIPAGAIVTTAASIWLNSRKGTN